MKVIDFSKLIKAIDFFAQNLSFEQIISYGYSFLHSTLELEESSIYIMNNDYFVLENQIDCEFKETKFKSTNVLKRIATRHGRVLQKELNDYFDKDFIINESVSFAIPIIAEDNLVGIIFCKSQKFDFNDFDLSSYFNAFNQLLNKSVESAKHFAKFKTVNADLDRKIFNLLFINHSTKALMEEIKIDKLYNLCIDVIRELTSSSVTSFGLYEEVRESIVLKGYNDILSFEKYYTELKLVNKNKKITKLVYSVSDEYEILKELFINPEEFLNLKAEYVVLIVKEEIIGFVTIGKSVNNSVYKPELLDQIESLSASIYIAIVNAQYIMTIETQKKESADQLIVLEQLAKSIKNINTCETISELCEISLQTLLFGFGIKKVIMVIKEDNKFIIKSKIGFGTNVEEFFISKKFEDKCLNDTFFESLADSSVGYIDSDLIGDIGDSNCFASVPLAVDEVKMVNGPLGFLVIFDVEKILDKKQILLIETLANSISPIIKTMRENESIKEMFKPNIENQFILKLENAIKNREKYYIDFSIYFKKIEKLPFQTQDLKEYIDIEVFYFSNTVFHISYNNEFNKELFDGKLDIEVLEEIYEETKNII